MLAPCLETVTLKMHKISHLTFELAQYHVVIGGKGPLCRLSELIQLSNFVLCQRQSKGVVKYGLAGVVQ